MWEEVDYPPVEPEYMDVSDLPPYTSPDIDRTNCRFPRWDKIDRVWICCHGGTNCGGCAAYPQNCKE